MKISFKDSMQKPISISRKKFILVSNPNAGRHKNSITDKVVKELELRGARVTFFPDDKELENYNWTQLTSLYDAVLGAGGDGTIRRLGALLAGTKFPLGIIPRGTGNVFAEEISLPKKACDIADVLMYGPEITIKGAMLNSQPFFLMTGVGFDGEIIYRLNYKNKKLLGKAAFIFPAIKAFFNNDIKLCCEIDGTLHDAAWLLSVNVQSYAGSFKLTHMAGFNKEGLIAILFEPENRLRMLRKIIALAFGRLEEISGVKFINCKNIRVKAAQPVHVEADGDYCGTTPLDIKWGAPRFRVIVPKHFAETFSTVSKKVMPDFIPNHAKNS